MIGARDEKMVRSNGSFCVSLTPKKDTSGYVGFETGRPNVAAPLRWYRWQPGDHAPGLETIFNLLGKRAANPVGVQFFPLYVAHYLDSRFITNCAGLPSISGER